MVKKKIIVKPAPKVVAPVIPRAIVKEEPKEQGPRCECGELALPKNHQCWACSHRN